MILPRFAFYEAALNRPDWKYVQLKQLIMKVIILFLLLLVSTGAQEAIVTRENVTCHAKEIINIDKSTVEGRIITILADSGYSIGMQKILLAQAQHESGGFNNKLTKNWNNLFAMLHSPKDPYSKGNWAKAEGRSGYAVYNSIEESVYARIWYSKRWNYPAEASPGEYVRHIRSKGYFTGNQQDYLNAIRKWINRDAHIFENKSVIIACR